MVSVGWGLLSFLNLPFLPRCPAPSAPCTPPRDSWEKEGDLSTLPPSPPTPPSMLHHSGAESVCLGEDSMILPEPPRFDDSPSDRYSGSVCLSVWCLAVRQAQAQGYYSIILLILSKSRSVILMVSLGRN